MFLSCQPTALSTPDRALVGVIIVVVLSTILCVPSYLEHRIVTVYHNETSPWNRNQSQMMITYRFEETKLSQMFALRGKVFVLHSVIFKLIPCLLILLFSFLLIQQLRHALEKSEVLSRQSTNGARSSATITGTARSRARRREKENRRTTMMLVIVCVLFLVTELPQGALLLLTFISKTHSKDYFEIYQQLGLFIVRSMVKGIVSQRILFAFR